MAEGFGDREKRQDSSVSGSHTGETVRDVGRYNERMVGSNPVFILAQPRIHSAFEDHDKLVRFVDMEWRTCSYSDLAIGHGAAGRPITGLCDFPPPVIRPPWRLGQVVMVHNWHISPDFT